MQLVEGNDVYSKIIAIRLLFERFDKLLGRLRKKYPAACKFVNETNHIENDYIFQLNLFKFFEIPDVYLNELKDLFLFCTFIVALISLLYQIFKGKK